MDLQSLRQEVELDSVDEIRAIGARPFELVTSTTAEVGPSEPAKPSTAPVDIERVGQPSPWTSIAPQPSA